MSFIEWYEWEQPVMLEVTEQRPMNNEYANSWISKLSPVTLKFFVNRQIKTFSQNLNWFRLYDRFPTKWRIIIGFACLVKNGEKGAALVNKNDLTWLYNTSASFFNRNLEEN